MNKISYNINELSRLAFYKWQLSGKKSMNTFLFTTLKKYGLNDKEFQKLIDNTYKRIDEYQSKQDEKITNEIEDELNNIIIYGDVI